MRRIEPKTSAAGAAERGEVRTAAERDLQRYQRGFDGGAVACLDENAHQRAGVEHRVINIDLGNLGGSALTDHNIDVPEQLQEGIPVTYVPARNTIFLSYALAAAEVFDAEAIVIGVNAVDYSGYPDCRPEFIDAFANLARLATKAGVEGKPLKIETPLLHLSKANIIRLGIEHGVDYSQTVSCYQADAQGRACSKCDSCRLRQQGFIEAGIADPTRYTE